jgi:diguanylate cyclase (GGDEF)-like protein
LSNHDSLTGLYNRRFFEEQMLLMDAGRADPISLISCDIDGLKIINDHFGHKYGDEMIRTVARDLQEAVRVDDLVARMGGDEFAVIMPRCPAVGVEQICQRIRDTIKEKHIKINGMELPVLISVGFAVRDGRAVSVSELLVEADNNMYQ